jgi:hypothetical protein
VTRTFAAINDPIHALCRRLTRQTALVAALSETGRARVEYRIRPGDLPEEYFTLASFHALQGLAYEPARFARWRVQPRAKPWVLAQANYFDAVRLDRRCLRDLRLKPAKLGPGLLAGEILSFGTGVLRARNDAPDDTVQADLVRFHGRLESPRQEVFARIRALSWNSLPLLGNGQTESFESTNLVYGDTFGELEQLWERRADTVLLELVAHSLQKFRRHAQLADYLCPPLNRGEVSRLHLSQGIWKAPPNNGRALLRRLEKILEWTILDDQAQTVSASPSVRTAAGEHWQADRSGYDGWLNCGGD